VILVWEQGKAFCDWFIPIAKGIDAVPAPKVRRETGNLNESGA